MVMVVVVVVAEVTVRPLAAVICVKSSRGGRMR